MEIWGNGLTNLTEVVLMAATIGVLAGYHLHLYIKVHRSPDRTAIGMTDRLRRQWVLTIMKERRDILAVQTLRNQVMASSFLASTAILISLGILNAAVRPSGFAEISHALNLAGT